MPFPMSCNTPIVNLETDDLVEIRELVLGGLDAYGEATFVVPSAQVQLWRARVRSSLEDPGFPTRLRSFAIDGGRNRYVSIKDARSVEDTPPALTEARTRRMLDDVLASTAAKTARRPANL